MLTSTQETPQWLKIYLSVDRLREWVTTVYFEGFPDFDESSIHAWHFDE